MNEKIEYEIQKAVEEAYRRGYAHGYSFGSSCALENINLIKGEINEWRYDLSIMKGAPGTHFSDTEMKWTTNSDRLNSDFKK